MINPAGVKKLTCLIVDDQRHCIDDLLGELNPFSHKIEVTDTAAGFTEAVEKIRRHKPDVLFLDVELGEKTGFDVLQHLGTGHQPIVVFVSAMAHYSLRAIKVNAADYLLKPVDTAELGRVIEKCRLQQTINLNLESLNLLTQDQVTHDFKPTRIAIRQSDALRVIPFEDLIFIEGESNYSRFHTTTKERILASMTLKEVEETIQNGPFLRCHKSYLVNTGFIEKLVSGESPHLKLKNGSDIPVARRRLREVSESLSGAA